MRWIKKRTPILRTAPLRSIWRHLTFPRQKPGSGTLRCCFRSLIAVSAGFLVERVVSACRNGNVYLSPFKKVFWSGSSQTAVEIRHGIVPSGWGTGGVYPFRGGVEQAPQERAGQATGQTRELAGDSAQVITPGLFFFGILATCRVNKPPERHRSTFRADSEVTSAVAAPRCVSSVLTLCAKVRQAKRLGDISHQLWLMRYSLPRPKCHIVLMSN